MRRLVIPLVVALIAVGCSTSSDPGDVGPLPEATPEQIRELLASSTRPILLNIWGSWCIPCRSEAPLLREAHARLGDEIRFVGISVRDVQTSARSFLNEFDLDQFEHFFDPDDRIQRSLGGRGAPETHFFAPGGELIELHIGIIDERTLALNLDELLRRSG